MGIRFKASIILRIIDSVYRTPIKNVNIAIQKHMNKVLVKDEGYYIIWNLEQGKYTVDIQHNDYESVRVEINNSNIENICEKVILLNPKPSVLNNKGGISTEETLSKYNEKQYSRTLNYCVTSKGNGLTILEDYKIGTNELSIKVSNGMIIDGAKFILEDMKTIGSIEKYDYEKKKFILENTLDGDIKIGDTLFLVNSSCIDVNGKYAVYLKDINDKDFVKILSEDY